MYNRERKIYEDFHCPVDVFEKETTMTITLPPDIARVLAERARERLNCVSLHISEVGPVVGTHVGPGTLGLAACPVGADGI